MPIHINQLIHSKRRTIALIIQHDGSLTVRAPLRMHEDAILEFVQNHAKWIQKKQAHAKASFLPPTKFFREGETFLFMGKEYPLNILANQRPALTFSGSRFQLTNSQVPKARQIFVRWYKDQALRVISGLISDQTNKSKFSYRKIRISSARTRWGSSSTNGTLSFTWRLIMAPPEVIDYVVVHELVHTQVRNHSQKFWALVEDIMPEYKQHVCWLKNNGHLLRLDED
jgi:predicted metal-dependent hydrolase